MIDYELFLEGTDLLEVVEFYSLFNEEAVTEASIAGMKITKENLEDEKFVKELISKIRSNPHKFRTNINGLLAIVGLISLITIVLAPIGILLLVITSMIKSGDQINEKTLKTLDDCFVKTIDKLKKKSEKTKDDTKKKELESIIKRLEENQEFIYNASEEERIRKLVDMSNYKNYGIKVGNGYLPAEISGYLIAPKGKLYQFCKTTTVNDIKEDLKVERNIIRYIEQLYMSNIKTRSDLLKYIKNRNTYNGNTLAIDEYSSRVKKYLGNKTLSTIIDMEENVVVYSHEDDCCYIWWAEEDDNIVKVTIEELLKASKIAYEDLVKIISSVK